MRKLGTWCIVGGNYSSMNLAAVYILSELRTVRGGGIEAVTQMPGAAGSWADLCKANPRNKQRLLDLGSAEFERVMTRWLDAFIPKPNEAIPGVPDYEFAEIKVPTIIVRGRREGLRPSEADLDGGQRPDQGLAADRAALARGRLGGSSQATMAGTGSLFDFWQLGAPAFLDFINE